LTLLVAYLTISFIAPRKPIPPLKALSPRAPKVFVKKLIKEHAGEVVLIVGHSNTTPFLVNMVLGEDKFQQLDESDYDEIFIVKSKEVGKGKVEVKSSAVKKD